MSQKIFGKMSKGEKQKRYREGVQMLSVSAGVIGAPIIAGARAIARDSDKPIKLSNIAKLFVGFGALFLLSGFQPGLPLRARVQILGMGSVFAGGGVAYLRHERKSKNDQSG